MTEACDCGDPAMRVVLSPAIQVKNAPWFFINPGTLTLQPPQALLCGLCHSDLDALCIDFGGRD